MSATPTSPAKTAAALGADLRAGRADAVELTEQTLAAINSHGDKAIFIDVLAARARREAAAAAARLKAGRPLSPLDGVPLLGRTCSTSKAGRRLQARSS